MVEKMYYTMGEVAEMLDVAPSLVRFWEKRFDAIAPNKNKKGNRLFTLDDVRTLKTIYHLVKERGMTLAGAEKVLKTRRGTIERDMELTERLGAIRALLMEVRTELGGGGVIVDDGMDSEPDAPPPPATSALAGYGHAPVIPTRAETSSASTAESAVAGDFAPGTAECGADGACGADGQAIFSTASGGAFAASEQEFATVRDRDDDPEYDSNPEFDHDPEPGWADEQGRKHEWKHGTEPAALHEVEPEPAATHEREPERVSEPEFELKWETEPELLPVHEWIPDEDPEEDFDEGSEEGSEEDSEEAPARQSGHEKATHTPDLTLF